MTPIGIEASELAFLAILNEQQIRYLVIGGAAVRCYSERREFADIDLLVDNSPTSAEHLHLVLRAAVGGQLQFDAAALEGEQKQIKLEAHGYAVDLLTSIEGFAFEDLYERRSTFQERDVPIAVVSKDDLIALKRAAAERDPDRGDRELRDVELLL